MPNETDLAEQAVNNARELQEAADMLYDSIPADAAPLQDIDQGYADVQETPTADPNVDDIVVAEPRNQNESNAVQQATEAVQEVANEAVGQMDTQEVRDRISNRIREIEDSLRRNNLITELTNELPPVSFSSRYTANLLNNSVDGSRTTSWKYTINGQDVVFDSPAEYAPIYSDYQNTASAHKLIAFEDYLNSEEHITTESVIDFINVTKDAIHDICKKMAKKRGRPDLSGAAFDQHERITVFLDKLMAKILGNPDPDIETKRNWIRAISDQTSLFFTIADAWNKYNESVEYKKEEVPVIGKVLSRYFNMIDRESIKGENEYAEIRNKIKREIEERMTDLADSGGTIRSRYCSMHDSFVLSYTMYLSSQPNVTYLTEKLFWDILQSMDEGSNYTIEDSRRMFMALVAKSKFNDFVLPDDMRDAFIQSSYSLFLRRTIKSRSTPLLDLDKAYELLSKPENITVFVECKWKESDNNALCLRVRSEASDVDPMIFVKDITSRNQFLGIMESEMIRPYEKFDKEKCYEVFNGFKNRFSAVDDPLEEVYTMMRCLEPTQSLAEYRMTRGYAQILETGFPFNFHVRHGLLKVAQILKFVYEQMMIADDMSKDFILHKLEDTNYNISMPIEFLIKLLGPLRFKKFIYTRRSTEIEALVTVLAYEDRFFSAETPLAGFWNKSEYIGDGLCLKWRLEKFSRKREQFTTLPVISWTEEPPTKVFTIKDLTGKWDGKSHLDRTEEFENKLFVFVKQEFARSFVSNPFELDLLKHVIRHFLFDGRVLKANAESARTVALGNNLIAFKHNFMTEVAARGNAMDIPKAKVKILKTLQEYIKDKRHFMFFSLNKVIRQMAHALANGEDL